MTILSWQDSEEQPVKFIEFDALMLEEYTRSADISQYSVESGATISDHVQPMPRAITLEAFVSDTPVATHNTVREGEHAVSGLPVGYKQPLDLTPHLRPYHAADGRGATQIVAGLPGQRVIRGNVERAKQHAVRHHAHVLQFNGDVTRIVDIFATLDALLDQRKALKVIFLEHEFSDMYITNLHAPIEAPASTGVTFTLDLVQLTAVEVQHRTGPTKTRKPANKNHVKRVSVGHKATGPMSNEAYAEMEDKSELDYFFQQSIQAGAGDTSGGVPWSAEWLGIR